eukprot:7056034-Pyramimonas_sp.AAC.1
MIRLSLSLPSFNISAEMPIAPGARLVLSCRNATGSSLSANGGINSASFCSHCWSVHLSASRYKSASKSATTPVMGRMSRCALPTASAVP